MDTEWHKELYIIYKLSNIMEKSHYCIPRYEAELSVTIVYIFVYVTIL
jgi:hypothetical protein